MAQVPPPSPAARVVLLVLLVIVVAFPGSAQQDAGKGPGTPLMTGGNATCMDCHLAEGMVFVDQYPEHVTEVPAGEVFTVNVTIQNPWLHHIENATVGFDLSDTDRLEFAGDRAPLHLEEDGSVAQAGGTTEVPFEVASGATEALVSVVGDDGSGLNDWDLVLRSPEGSSFPGTQDGFQDSLEGEPTHRDRVALDQSQLLEGGVGNWTAEVTMERGSAPANTFTLRAHVYYNLSSAEVIHVGGSPRLDQGEQHTFTVRIKALNETGPATLGTNVTLLATAEVPDEHPRSGIPNIQNVGSRWEYSNQTFEVGDELVKSTPEVQEVSLGVNPIILLRSYAFILGWVSAALLPFALVLGGTFGRGSIGWLNDLMGARRRVLWHNAASYGLLIVALLHMGAFLFEPTREWTKGLLFGGLALASLMGLAFTGTLQKSMVKRYGFSAWRFVHLSLAILMVLFVLLHLTVDGTDLQFIRDWFAG